MCARLTSSLVIATPCSRPNIGVPAAAWPSNSWRIASALAARRALIHSELTLSAALTAAASPAKCVGSSSTMRVRLPNLSLVARGLPAAAAMLAPRPNETRVRGARPARKAVVSRNHGRPRIPCSRLFDHAQSPPVEARLRPPDQACAVPAGPSAPPRAPPAHPIMHLTMSAPTLTPLLLRHSKYFATSLLKHSIKGPITPATAHAPRQATVGPASEATFAIVIFPVDVST
jgi:hypothetical protein